jgi:hypothetical protein
MVHFEQERVGQVLDWWLRAEVRESRDGRNKVWDDFNTVRGGYVLPFEQNQDALKVSNHYSRFDRLIGNYPSFAGNDHVIGRIIHHSLMFVSGNFRTQCFLQAADQAGYEENRFGKNNDYNGAAGVDIGTSIGRTMQKFEELGKGNLDNVVSYSKAVNKQIHDFHNHIYGWHVDNPDRATEALDENEFPVQMVRSCQVLGLQLAAGHVVLAAQMRGGDLERVPILEPKSITDAPQDPMYPFER